MQLFGPDDARTVFALCAQLTHSTEFPLAHHGALGARTGKAEKGCHRFLSRRPISELFRDHKSLILCHPSNTWPISSSRYLRNDIAAVTKSFALRNRPNNNQNGSLQVLRAGELQVRTYVIRCAPITTPLRGLNRKLGSKRLTYDITENCRFEHPRSQNNNRFAAFGQNTGGGFNRGGNNNDGSSSNCGS